MADDAKFLRATIANVLTPIFFGLHNAINDTSNQMVAFINTNRKLIATNITTYMIDLAEILVKGVAFGIKWVSRGVSGLIEAWHVMGQAGSEVTSILLTGVEKLLFTMAKATAVFDKELAVSLATTAGEVRFLSAQWEAQADAHLLAAQEQVEFQKNLETTIAKLEELGLEFLGDAEIAILKEIAKGWTTISRSTGEATSELRNHIAAFDAMEPSIAALMEREAALTEKTARHLDTIQQQQLATQKQIGQGIATAYAGAFSSIMEGSQSAGEALRSATIQSAETAVMSFAASGAAASAFANAGIPIIGPILAVAAAGMMFAFIKTFMAKIPKAAMGGVVTGGTPGRDSVGVLVQRDEGILRGGQTAAIQRLGDALTEGRGGAGPTIQQTNNFTSVVPPTSAETARSMREVNKQLKRIKRRGF
jgi:hypothetical protein